MRGGQRLELLVVIGHFSFYLLEFFTQLAKQLRAQRRQLGVFRFELRRQGVAKGVDTRGSHNAIFGQEPTYCVDESRARPHEAFAHAVQGLEILLRHIFDGHKPHAGTRHRLRDSFGITQVIFVRLHIV